MHENNGLHWKLAGCFILHNAFSLTVDTDLAQFSQAQFQHQSGGMMLQCVLKYRPISTKAILQGMREIEPNRPFVR